MNLLNHILTFFAMSAFAFSTAFAQSGNVTVASDKSLTADFSQFKSFDFAKQLADDKIQIFFLDDLVLKGKVKEAVQYELEARGYDQTSNNPDLIVNFQILDESTEFTGYTGVYRDENYWTADEMRKDIIGLVPEAEVRTSDNARTYQLKEGTLMVHLVDAESGELIWQGYASGILDNKNRIGEDDKVKEAVSLIFQTYDWRADDVSVNN
jgi:hypothetical protein